MVRTDARIGHHRGPNLTPALLHPHLRRKAVADIPDLVNQVSEEHHVAAGFDLQIPHQPAIHTTHLGRGELRLAEIQGLAASRPELTGDRSLVRSDLQTQGTWLVLVLPGDHRHPASTGDRAKKQPQRRPQLTFTSLEPMPGIGDVQGVLRTNQVVPVVVQSVDTPVGVVGAVDDQLGLGQPSTVGVRIDPVPQPQLRLLLEQRDQPLAGVITDLPAVLAPLLFLVLQLYRKAQILCQYLRTNRTIDSA